MARTKTATINFGRWVQTEAAAAVEAILSLAGGSVALYDANDRILMGGAGKGDARRVPVLVDGRTVGQVVGGVHAEPVARALSFLSAQEAEKRALMARVADKAHEAELIRELNEKFFGLTTPEDIAVSVVDEATAHIESTGASLMLINEETGNLEILAAFGRKFEDRPVLKPGVGIVGDVLLTGRGEIINDATKDPRFVPGAHPVISLICVPILKDDQVLGAVNVSSNRPVMYTKNDLELVSLLASQAALALERAREFTRMVRAVALEGEAAEPAPAKPAPAPEARPADSDEPISEMLRRCLDRDEEGPAKPGDACREDMAVLVLDIRAFAEHIRDRDPRQNFSFLQNFVEAVSPVISRHGGFVEQWLGDGQVVLFPESGRGAVDDALAAAVEIQKQVTVFSRKREEALHLPVSAGVGISAGTLTFGVIGFDSGLVSTVVGEPLLAASRLERLTKIFGIKIAISEPAYQNLNHPKGFCIREVDLVEVPGVKRSFSVYEVFDADPAGQRDAKKQCLQPFQEALENYRAKNFEEAAQGFNRIKQFIPFDRVTDIYLARLAAYRRNPPRDSWVGVTRMAEA